MHGWDCSLILILDLILDLADWNMAWPEEIYHLVGDDMCWCCVGWFSC